jgi:hypothetical protein
MPFSFYCKKPVGAVSSLPFAETPVAAAHPIVSPAEISGIDDSRKNPGYLWAEQDSGNPPAIYLIGYDGTVVKSLLLKGAQNRDWEDMQLAVGPGSSAELYIYLADIGDNNAQYDMYFFYRFLEPAATQDTVKNWEKIKFRYADGPHDAEAFLVDPGTMDIYLLTKRDSVSGIYRIPNPVDTGLVHTAKKVGSLSFSGVVSASMSFSNTEIIVKTYTQLFYWKRNKGELIENTLKKSPITLGYTLEPQGEAICFKHDNSGFFTLSEKGLANQVSLFYYKRN